MKTFLKILLLALLTGYLIFAFVRLSDHPDATVCSKVEVQVTHSDKAGFITPKEVERLLHEANLYPVGQLMDSINGMQIEDELKKNPFVKGVTCYKTPGGKASIIVEQRLPVMRILPENQNSYYIDEQGMAMETHHYNSDLVVATGKMDSAFIQDKLVFLGLYIHNNKFWNDQITQIHVHPNQHVDLITRVGGNILIHFGTLDSISRKFNNLKAFYDKVMPEVGWNTYREISLEYNNQIVCKRR